MRSSKLSLSAVACAVTLAVASSPAIAGHKHGGHYNHSYYGMHYGNRDMHRHNPRYCAKNTGKYGPSYGMWGPRGHHPMKGKMYGGYGKPMKGYQYGYGKPMKGKTYGNYGKSTSGSGYAVGAEQGSGKASYDKGGYAADSSYTTQTETPAAAAASAKDIVGIASAAGNFTTLISAVQAAGLADTLSGDGPFTVLAPSDAAFNLLPKEKVAGLMSDPEALRGVLTYHVIAGELSAAELLEKGKAETVNGASVSVAQLDVAKADVKASNGVIHVLNNVLIPPQ
ncbi:MAG: fasciclin domain-containing protein [Sedimenticolaceae bacterium]